MIRHAICRHPCAHVILREQCHSEGEAMVVDFCGPCRYSEFIRIHLIRLKVLCCESRAHAGRTCAVHSVADIEEHASSSWLRLTTRCGLGDEHLLVEPVKHGVIVAQERHTKDPHGSISRVLADGHEGRNAPLLNHFFGLEDVVPHVLLLNHDPLLNPHDVCLRWKFHLVVAEAELEYRELMEITAIPCHHGA